MNCMKPVVWGTCWRATHGKDWVWGVQRVGNRTEESLLKTVEVSETEDLAKAKKPGIQGRVPDHGGASI